MRRDTPQHMNLTRLPCPWAGPLSSPLDLISTLHRRSAPPSSLLWRRRALDGGALLDFPHHTCGSTVERSYVRSLFEGLLHLLLRSRSVRGESHGSDLFEGLHRVNLPQLSINFFRCDRTTV